MKRLFAVLLTFTSIQALSGDFVFITKSNQDKFDIIMNIDRVASTIVALEKTQEQKVSVNKISVTGILTAEGFCNYEYELKFSEPEMVVNGFSVQAGGCLETTIKN
jgi:hypothetical protein